jgi:hypothetical protein
MKFDSEVKPLCECILEIRGTQKETSLAMNNLVDIYAAKFNMDTIEEVFEFPETFLGCNDDGEIDWSNWATIDNTYSLLKDPDQEEGVFIPHPETIGDFIDDCRRVWSVSLIWEPALINRYFQIK